MAKKRERSDRSRLQALAKVVGDAIEADVIVYAGGTYPPNDDRFNHRIRSHDSAKNALVLLTTFGGTADSAYRIARCLQEVYKRGTVWIFVDTFCKSAGTLLALGADEIIMSDWAEFGALDVQLRKPEEIGERVSGLTAMQALSTLQSEAYNAFENFFVQLRRRTQISTKIASDVAAQLTVGLFSPIYSQMEPMRLGENQRAMRIAEQYGERLLKVSDNLKPSALDRLLGEYPSHEFVIDRSEAKELFRKLRSPDKDELNLAIETRDYAVLRAIASVEDEQNLALIDILSVAVNEENDDEDNEVPQATGRSVPEDQGEADGGSNEVEGNSTGDQSS